MRGVETVAGVEALRAERSRILGALLSGLDELTERGFEAIRREIPAYAAQRDERFLADLRNQIRLVYATNLTSLLEDRVVTLDDIAFVRGAAMRRAQIGFALEDYLAAYRVGQQALWEAIVEHAGDSTVGHEAALTLAAPIMRMINFASTHAGHAYVEFRQAAVAEADRDRRDLLELLLAGELPAQGRLQALAKTHGLVAGSAALVVAATAEDPRGPQTASAALTRERLSENTLVVVRQSEIVAVPVLRAGADPTALCERIVALQKRLAADGARLVVGISTVVDVAELRRAYGEARAARECVRNGGVMAIPLLAPFEYLVLRAGTDDTARRVVDPALRAFLDDDRARGGVLAETVQAFARADLNLKVAADRLHVHPNTAQYRLRRIEEKTGRNPRRIADLLDLLVAIALEAPST
jgi:hypothetical protein